MLQCAVGVIQNSENQILICKRPLHKVGGGFWEFPGGKLEVAESPEEALTRELKEELGITPISFERLMSFPYDYNSFQVFLDIFLIRDFEGEPNGLEGQPIAWVNVKSLPEYPFLEANTRIIKQLMDMA